MAFFLVHSRSKILLATRYSSSWSSHVLNIVYIAFAFTIVCAVSFRIHGHLPPFQAWPKQRPFPVQSCVVFAIIGTMASSDFSRHIASDFPSRVILPLLCTFCHFPGRGPGDGVRPPQSLQILSRHSTTPTPGKGGPALPDSSGRLLSSPPTLGFDLSLVELLRRSSIRFMLRTADLLSLSGFTYRFDTGITPRAGYMLHGFPASTMAGLAPASTCRLIWAHGRGSSP